MGKGMRENREAPAASCVNAAAGAAGAAGAEAWLRSAIAAGMWRARRCAAATSQLPQGAALDPASPMAHNPGIRREMAETLRAYLPEMATYLREGPGGAKPGVAPAPSRALSEMMGRVLGLPGVRVRAASLSPALGAVGAAGAGTGAEGEQGEEAAEASQHQPQNAHYHR